MNASSENAISLETFNRKKAALAEKRDSGPLKIIEDLKFERSQLKLNERQQEINTALRGLDAGQVKRLGAEIRRLTGLYYDEAKAQDEANKAREEGKSLTESLLTPLEKYNVARPPGPR